MKTEDEMIKTPKEKQEILHAFLDWYSEIIGQPFTEICGDEMWHHWQGWKKAVKWSISKSINANEELNPVDLVPTSIHKIPDSPGKEINEVSNSYHDVVVIIDDLSHQISTASYGYRLECLRSTGWRLWHISEEEEKLMGGEFDNNRFQIEIRGIIVFDNQFK